MKDIDRIAVMSSVIFWISVTLLSFVIWGLAKSWEIMQAVSQALG